MIKRLFPLIFGILLPVCVLAQTNWMVGVKGTQTVTGVKFFTNNNLIVSITPSESNNVASKNYVDCQLATNLAGVLTNSYSANVILASNLTVSGTITGTLYGVSSTSALASNLVGMNTTNIITNNQAFVTLYSTNPGPVATELVTADWVRSLLRSGIYLHYTTNVTTSGYDTVSFAYSITNPASVFSRAHSVVSNNQYIGTAFSPELVTNSHGPVVVSIYIGRSANPFNVSIKPELYFTVDKTNTLYEAQDVLPQPVATGTNLMQWVFSFPDQATSYVMSRLKTSGISSTGTLTIYGGGATPSTLSINGTTGNQ